MVRQTRARSRESNSSTPRLVSMTSGPDTAMRPRSDTASARAAAGDQAAAAIAAGAAADQADDLHARRARLHHRAHDLGDREFAGIGFLQPHAAGIEQDQHGGSTLSSRAARSRPSQLGAVHLAEGAAHEAAFLRGDEYRRAVEPAAPDDDAVIELLAEGRTSADAG